MGDWYNQLQTQARALEIWDYIRLEGDGPDSLKAPVKPDKPDWDTAHSGRLAELQWQSVEYREDRAVYLKKKETLDGFVPWMKATVPPMPITDQEDEAPTAKDLLLELQARHAPSNEARTLELEYHYNRLCKPKAQNIFTWIFEWQKTAARRIKLGDISELRARTDFVRANRQIDEIFALLRRKESLDDSISFNALSDKFIAFYQKEEMLGNNISIKAATFASGQKPDLDGKDRKGRSRIQNRSQSKPQLSCICGKSHYYNQCFYLVPSKSYKGWKENAEIRKKIDKQLNEDSQLRGKVERAKEYAKAKAKAKGKDAVASASNASEPERESSPQPADSHTPDGKSLGVYATFRQTSSLPPIMVA